MSDQCLGQGLQGLVLLGQNGRMVYSRWVLDNGKYYYIDARGYMLAGTTAVINGQKYTFDKNGVNI